MKRTIAILLVAVMALTLFAACGAKKDKDDTNDAKDAKEQLYGTWVLTDVEGDNDAAELVRALLPYMETTYTFNSDGTLKVSATMNGEEQTMDAEYSVKGDQLTVNGETGKFEVSGDTLRMFLESDGYTVVYKKQ